MLHTILSWIAGFISLAAMQYTRNYIKSHQDPINLINGIVLPDPSDPDWKLDPYYGPHRLNHKNVYVTWNNGHSLDHSEFDPFICTNETFVISKAKAFKYVKAVRKYHMKYMVECPEIKNLDSLSSSKQLNANS